MEPKITVFMAAYNAAPFIEESITSILNQTFRDFEFIIVDDGSTDETASIIEGFNDSRILLVKNETNKGLQFTRNRLLNLARGMYIAILDADDVALPERLEKQYNFLSTQPQIALCGGHAEIIDEHGVIQQRKIIVPTNQHVNMYMLFCNPFINSSSMFRTEVFIELNGYHDYVISEDFDLFIRFSEKYEVANIDEFLVKYRIHGNNITLKKSDSQIECELKILGNMQKALGMSADANLLNIHLELFTSNIKLKHHFDYFKLLKTIKLANDESHRFNVEQFHKFIFQKCIELIKLQKANKKALSWYFDSNLFRWTYFNFKQFRKISKISLRGIFS
ncbi:glycosyltransferase [Pedobacter frigidisoli]|uniref:Glycosyltransferase n=1 Tax=Pedobacter frigidisoli TaxID=2530455 RepID=A0A4R0P7N4_9SPHI|nr:glycosyltransferase [Pedobacter frigidisoli]TCD12755.1 glycosyltransferase [Pedobacter frigidisoli]